MPLGQAELPCRNCDLPPIRSAGTSALPVLALFLLSFPNSNHPGTIRSMTTSSMIVPTGCFPSDSNCATGHSDGSRWAELSGHHPLAVFGS